MPFKSLISIIRRRLFLLALAGGLLLVLLVGLLQGVNQRKVYQQSHFQMGKVVATTIQNYLRNSREVLQNISREVSFKHNVRRELESFHQTYPVFDSLMLLDRSGLVVAGAPVDMHGIDYSSFVAVEEDSPVSLSPSVPYISPETGRLVVNYAVSMPVGTILVGEMALETLQDHVAKIFRTPEKGSLFFFTDRYGNVLAHSEQAVVEQQANLGHLEMIREARSTRDGASGFYEIFDDAYLGVVCKVPGTKGWMVALATPALSVYLPIVKASATAMGVFLLIVLGLVVALSRWMRRRVARPLMDFSENIRAMAKGVYPQETAGSADFRELAELKEQFQHMGEQVYEREKQLKTQAQSLARQTEKLEEANVRLQELDKLKSAFLSSVSHELRTPLTSVLGFAKLIHRDFARAFLPVDGQDGSKKKRAERISKNLEIIQHEGERLTRLINDVLDLTKIESGRMSWNDRPVPAEELIKHAVNVVQGHFEDNPDVKLVLDVQEDLPQLLVDPDRMEQVLINLLNNAAKFTRRGEVRLQARRMEAGGVRISVTDSGPGIAPEDLDRIFDMFHQVQQRETGGEKPEGTGLGLAISRQIVNHYQGRLWAESETGQGSTFVVELPAPAEAEADAIEPAPAEAEAPMVLVVDDEPAIRSLLRQILEEEGCRVVTAHDGESALDKARSRPPDLVTMDIMMPGMSGKEVIERFREELELAHIPLLVVTILQDFRNSRADAALAKPIDEDKLVAAVHSLLQSPKAVRPMMALTPDGEADESACFTLCRGEISQCSESELWETVESGFRGTVIVPAWAADRVDLSRLAARENVQVVILPS